MEYVTLGKTGWDYETPIEETLEALHDVLKAGKILISASFGPSTVRVNTETVYSDRREAGVVMTSISARLRAPA